MPARRSRSPNPAKRPRIEDRLLLAMEQLLEQGHSFSALSIEQLTGAAGLARATFYLHFRDKGELVTRLMQRVRDEIVDSAGLWFEHAELARREDMRRALRGILGVYQKHHVIIDAVMETARNDAQVARLWREMLDALCAESRDAVQHLRVAGRAHADVTPLVADALTWSVNYCAMHYGSKLRGAALEKLTDTLTHVCWNAIVAPDEAAGAGK
ncbi:MAG TPA: TetR/AcrR family transcriptional regulator [Nevskia sp.]|nr:TetR/AcrR family transcriptional regulator [Nevskia sp.]